MRGLVTTLQFRLRHISHWHLTASQSAGWVGSSLTLLSTCVRLLLQHYFGIKTLWSWIYAPVGVFTVYLIYRTWQLLHVFIFDPLPLEPSEIIIHQQEHFIDKNESLSRYNPFPDSQSYVHKPIKSDTFSRLLLLKPARSHSAELIGDLVEFPYGTGVYYGALSYAWGSLANPGYILLDGKKLQISSNCATALRQLRLPYIARMLWIDAICIDQNNIDEKDEQLTRMGAIYGHAAEVLVWLGDGSNSIEIALRYLKLYSMHLYIPFGLQKRFKVAIITRIIERNHTQLVQGLLAAPWYRRIWTLQEVALARPNTVKMLCGSKQTNYDWVSYPLVDLETYLSLINQYTYNNLIGANALTIRSLTRMFVKDHDDVSKSLRLSQLMLQLQTHHSTDPKDRIYGLLAIFEKTGMPAFPEPSYAKTVGRIYWDAMVALCEYEQSLRLLLLLPRKIKDDMIGIPGWVPDFRSVATPRRLLVQSFKAAGDSKSSFSIIYEGRKLVTLAVIVDTIREVSVHTVWQPTFNSSFIKDSITKNLEEGAEQTILALRNWFWIPFTEGYPCRYESRLEAIRETLLLGSHFSLSSEHFDDWLQLLMATDKLWHEYINRGAEEFEMKDEHIYQLLEHARADPTLQANFFKDDAPFHHFTEDFTWKIMCILKTVPGIEKVQHQVWTLARDTSFFVTQTGYMGTGPQGTKAGDTIGVIPGVEMPMILRKVGLEYEVIGPTYLHGFMKGEKWNEIADSVEQIVLV